MTFRSPILVCVFLLEQGRKSWLEVSLLVLNLAIAKVTTILLNSKSPRIGGFRGPARTLAWDSDRQIPKRQQQNPQNLLNLVNKILSLINLYGLPLKP
jgi:hypothetical protein